MKFRSGAILALLVAASSALPAVAEAQTRYFMRERIAGLKDDAAPASNAPGKRTCTKVSTGIFLDMSKIGSLEYMNPSSAATLADALANCEGEDVAGFNQCFLIEGPGSFNGSTGIVQVMASKNGVLGKDASPFVSPQIVHYYTCTN